MEATELLSDVQNMLNLIHYLPTGSLVILLNIHSSKVGRTVDRSSYPPWPDVGQKRSSAYHELSSWSCEISYLLLKLHWNTTLVHQAISPPIELMTQEALSRIHNRAFILKPFVTVVINPWVSQENLGHDGKCGDYGVLR